MYKATKTITGPKFHHWMDELKMGAFSLGLDLVILSYRKGLLRETIVFGLEGPRDRVVAMMAAIDSAIEDSNANIDAILTAVKSV